MVIVWSVFSNFLAKAGLLLYFFYLITAILLMFSQMANIIIFFIKYISWYFSLNNRGHDVKDSQKQNVIKTLYMTEKYKYYAPTMYLKICSGTPGTAQRIIFHKIEDMSPYFLKDLRFSLKVFSKERQLDRSLNH